MSIVFSRSVRSIETDSHRLAGAALAVAALLFVTWIAWFLFARIAVIEVAESARLEVEQAAHSIEAPVSGRVVTSGLVLGQDVTEGDVLVELDAEPMRLALDEAKAHQSSFAPQAAALSEQVAAEERASEDHRRATRDRIDEASARSREVESAAKLAEGETLRTARLRAEGLASEADALRAKSNDEQKRAVSEGSRLTVTRIESEERVGQAERQANIARLRLELAQLDGQRATGAATLKQLEYEVERRLVRAPISGRLGEVATLRVGSVLREGDKLGAVIPRGDIRIVGEFLPGRAIGRIQPGQHAHMRPDGFAWTQYGMLDATVRRVASEPRSGRIRVELDVQTGPESAIPILHGMPGTLEVEIDRVSPAVLVLRNAGSRLASPAHATPSGSESGESPESSAVRP